MIKPPLRATLLVGLLFCLGAELMRAAGIPAGGGIATPVLVAVGNSEAQVFRPEKPAVGRPWVLGFAFYDPQRAGVAYVGRVQAELLRRGFHVVAFDLGNTFGAPEVVNRWNEVYERVTTKYGLARKAVLIGVSREGLSIIRWAAENPDRVACMYLDRAVFDFKSWPGGKLGLGKGSPVDWQTLQSVYHFSSEAAAMAYDKNPVDLGPVVATAGIPLLYVAGGNDEDVPYSENGAKLEQQYRSRGAPFELIMLKEVGHHPHGLKDPSPIIDFIERNATGVTGRPRD